MCRFRRPYLKSAAVTAGQTFAPLPIVPAARYDVRGSGSAHEDMTLTASREVAPAALSWKGTKQASHALLCGGQKGQGLTCRPPWKKNGAARRPLPRPIAQRGRPPHGRDLLENPRHHETRVVKTNDSTL